MTSPTKLLFCIADGMGDWPIDDLDGRTPLEAAHTPHMDALAAKGRVGTCQTVPKDMPPGSDVANMALMGFDPATFHTGRGPIEAAAQGLDLAEDDLVWRMNLVTVSDFSKNGTMLDYSAGHIDTHTAAALVANLKQFLDGDVFTMQPGVQYRHLLVQKGGANAPEATMAIRPPHDITDRSIAKDIEAYNTSRRLYDLVCRAADQLQTPENASKANAVWPWGQGKRLTLPSFAETFGRHGAVISAVDLVKGLGRAASMEVINVPGATGLLDTNYEGKVRAAFEFLLQGDFVFMHVEAPDECGHGGDPHEKVEAIERFDARIMGPLIKAMPNAAFLVACDHYTPLQVRTHTHDAVPFLLSWPGCPAGSGVSAFTEAAANSQKLKLKQGDQLMRWAIGQLG